MSSRKKFHVIRETYQNPGEFEMGRYLTDLSRYPVHLVEVNTWDEEGNPVTTEMTLYDGQVDLCTEVHHTPRIPLPTDHPLYTHLQSFNRRVMEEGRGTLTPELFSLVEAIDSWDAGGRFQNVGEALMEETKKFPEI